MSCIPITFLFYGRSARRSEFDDFIWIFRRRERLGLDNTWILKPSHGGKGNNIVVVRRVLLGGLVDENTVHR